MTILCAKSMNTVTPNIIEAQKASRGLKPPVPPELRLWMIATQKSERSDRN